MVEEYEVIIEGAINGGGGGIRAELESISFKGEASRRHRGAPFEEVNGYILRGRDKVFMRKFNRGFAFSELDIKALYKRGSRGEAEGEGDIFKGHFMFDSEVEGMVGFFESRA